MDDKYWAVEESLDSAEAESAIETMSTSWSEALNAAVEVSNVVVSLAACWAVEVLDDH